MGRKNRNKNRAEFSPSPIIQNSVTTVTITEPKVMEEKKTIILKHPITIKADSGADIETNKLFIGRLKVKHLKLLPDDMENAGGMGRAKMVMPLIAAICGIDEAAVGEIDIEDLDVICKELDGFFGRSPETGKS